MAERNRIKDNEKFLKESRGCGSVGKAYKIQDVPWKGRVTRIKSITTDR